jgi:hypothetical protein
MTIVVEDKHKQVAEYVRIHPDLTFFQISQNLGICYSSLTRIAAAYGLSRPREIRLNPEALEKK